MTKTARARYTLEFKQEAVRLVEGGQSIAAAARTLLEMMWQVLTRILLSGLYLRRPAAGGLLQARQ
jgi:hypothetical protein